MPQMLILQWASPAFPALAATARYEEWGIIAASAIGQLTEAQVLSRLSIQSMSNRTMFVHDEEAISRANLSLLSHAETVPWPFMCIIQASGKSGYIPVHAMLARTSCFSPRLAEASFLQGIYVMFDSHDASTTGCWPASFVSSDCFADLDQYWWCEYVPSAVSRKTSHRLDVLQPMLQSTVDVPL
ncbi:hypothetical protein EDD37DRAFT_612841 [Exophiala viscosa]|uniref:uncharacterized protein n=1 Tax=Exophiala viscosa TaxID=2486360 RepID=UPI0021A0280C|nr:hypothetical protein EDD37DRAFT_612841 [Exophiala viscosa]